MNKYSRLIDSFTNRTPLVNIVLDGYGIGSDDNTNAIFSANTPYMDFLFANYPNTKLLTHGRHVGLPGEKDLGGSEVGHLTIGAGKIYQQGPTLISNAIRDGSFYQKETLRAALRRAKNGSLHLLGLLSDGNVHSHLSHFVAVIEEAVRHQVKNCYVHALLDGRDVGIQTADIYINKLEKLFHSIVSEHEDWNYGFASGGGREVITMDRDMNWDKVEAGWKTHVLGESGNNFNSATEAVTHFREVTPGLIDQDCQPFNVYNSRGEIPKIQDGDSVIMMNFRADRAIEITRAFTEKGFNGFNLDQRPDTYFVGMMVYDEDNNIPKNRIMDGTTVDNPFGKRILTLGLNQFRLAETQKYAHVTFFFNGGYRNPLDNEKEIYHLIQSDKINSFASAPKMKAFDIAAKATEFILSREFDFGLINFANADMVGHTGDMESAILAAEAVDQALRLVCAAIEKVNGIAVITADHGNADEMIIVNPKTNSREVCTKHSINPVPFIIFDPLYKGGYSLAQPDRQNELNLSMIAATNFILLGKAVPSDINDPLLKP